APFVPIEFPIPKAKAVPSPDTVRVNGLCCDSGHPDRYPNSFRQLKARVTPRPDQPGFTG
ncbi:MAG: hypothetical protein KGO02_02765, partial [Alphaproteobacteria bacterium]|nr:hypothetical protein [Alphaproteobacteria bacterium]